MKSTDKCNAPNRVVQKDAFSLDKYFSCRYAKAAVGKGCLQYIRNMTLINALEEIFLFPALPEILPIMGLTLSAINVKEKKIKIHLPSIFHSFNKFKK